MVPSIEMVRFVTSGTEATMTAIRLARAATGRTRVIKVEGGYHGHGDSFLVAAGSGVATLSIAGSPGVPERARDPDVGRARTTTRRRSTTPSAGFPGRSRRSSWNRWRPTWGSCPRGPAYLSAVAEITRRHGALLIFDEVISGFRVASGGAAGARTA